MRAADRMDGDGGDGLVEQEVPIVAKQQVQRGLDCRGVKRKLQCSDGAAVRIAWHLVGVAGGEGEREAAVP